MTGQAFSQQQFWSLADTNKNFRPLLAHILMFIKLSNPNQELQDKGTPTCTLKFYHTTLCIFGQQIINSIKWYYSTSFPGPFPWLGGGAGKGPLFPPRPLSQGKGPGNEAGYYCVVFLEDLWRNFSTFSYPGFDMFMLTSVHVDATSHASNNKYMGQCST